MSNIPTIAATIRYVDTYGLPVAGATITAALNVADTTFQGAIVPGLVSGVTDTSGKCVLRLFPNALGAIGSLYALTATPPLGCGLTRYVGIPNADCDVLLGPRALAVITGPQGLPGERGATGATVAWKSGAGVPASAIGGAGDMYLDSASGDVYGPKTAVWGTPVANIKGPTGPAAQTPVIPGHYDRDNIWAVKGSAMPADRYTLLSPNRLTVNVDDVGLYLAEQIAMDLSSADVWDTTTTDYTVAANRAGKDFYIYACLVGGMILKLLVSANATYPTGYTADNSRKICGFHCLCANAGGSIYDPTFPLADFMAGDILPASIWDLKHRPVSSPEGMVYVAGIGKWADIYLASASGSALVSVYGGTIADGGSTPAFHSYKFSQWLGKIAKRLPTQHEFVALSLGSNQGTNISGSADPGTAGGHTDTAGLRMISNCGCEDCCGVIWQWSSEAGGAYAAASYVYAYDGLDSGVAGKSYGAPNRALLGGAWPDGVVCGSRSSYWGTGPLALSAYYGARGVAETLAG